MNILYFAPIRLYPDGHGNIATVHQYIRRLRNNGHKVHYLYFDEFSAPSDLFFSQRYVDTFDFVKKADNHIYQRDEAGYFMFDTYYQQGLGEKVRKLCQTYNIDVVICTYVMHSKILEYVPDGILKIIDTHDKMTDRHLSLNNNGIKDEFFSCTKEDEARYLLRADIVWARTDCERDYFNEICKQNKAITVSHFNNPNYFNKNINQIRRIGYLASDNNVNAKMTQDFIAAYLKHKNINSTPIEVVIGGNVINILKHQSDFMKEIENSKIKLIGRVENIADFYKDIDIVIVPIMFGTGINVKMIEAMSFGMPVVSTKCGSKGCGNTTSPYHNCEDINDLLDKIYKLYKHPQDIKNLTDTSKQIFNDFYNNNIKTFDHCFSKQRINEAKNATLCSGCGICAGICPQNAINMQIDTKGFYRPQKTKDCTNCGICDKICALKNKMQYSDAKYHDKVFGNYDCVYAASSNDDSVRLTSSTAGFIRTFASYYSHKFDGVVTLCESKNVLKPEVKLLNQVNEILKDAVKSTYFSVEVSQMARILKEKEGNYLVIGLPCQIASLKKASKYLKGKFFSVELFCGALYSLNFMKNYILAKGGENRKIDFRDKTSGWHNFSLSLTDEKLQTKIQTNVNDDEFYFAQRNKIYTQSSCLTCSYCHNGTGDIQVGDFWGEKYQNNEKGVNLIVCKNEIAGKLVEECKDLNLTHHDIRDVYQSQPWFVEYYRRNVLNSSNLPPEKQLDEKLKLNSLMYPHIDDITNIRNNYKKQVELNKKSSPFLSRKSFLIITSDTTLGSFGDQAMTLTLINSIRNKYKNADIALFNLYYNIEDGVLLNNNLDIYHHYPVGDVCEYFEKIIDNYTDVLVIGADVLDGGCGHEHALKYYKLMEIADAHAKNVQIQGFSFNKTQDAEITEAVKKVSAFTKLNVRDKFSYDRLKKIGCNNLVQVADMAFCFNEENFAKSNYALSLKEEMIKLKKSGKRIIGLHLTKSKNEDYNAFLNKISDVLSQYSNIVAIALPHDYRVYADKYSDFEMCNLICAELKRKNIPCINAYGLASEADVKHVIGEADVLITSRMHIAIAALSKSVPTISFVYQNKFEGLYAFYDFKENLMFDSNDFATSDLQNALDYLLSNKFSQMFNSCNAKITELSKKNFHF